MAQDSLARWAEPAPDTGPMTPDELLQLPEDKWLYKLVEGGWSAGGGHGGIAGNLLIAMGMWVKPLRARTRLRR